MPIISILQARNNGIFSHLIQLIIQSEEKLTNYLYFWITGLFSAFLDNTPTYLIFFHITGNSPEILMESLPKTLIAISAGSVFMGGLTYIGNAPNFIIKSISESYNIPMPSFLGYILWSFTILTPLFCLISWLFL